MALVHKVFAVLSLHAKMHQRLSTVDTYAYLMERIETEEIKSYNNNWRYKRLEALKQELLSIKFGEKN